MRHLMRRMVWFSVSCEADLSHATTSDTVATQSVRKRFVGVRKLLKSGFGADLEITDELEGSICKDFG